MIIFYVLGLIAAASELFLSGVSASSVICFSRKKTYFAHHSTVMCRQLDVRENTVTNYECNFSSFCFSFLAFHDELLMVSETFTWITWAQLFKASLA